MNLPHAFYFKTLIILLLFMIFADTHAQGIRVAYLSDKNSEFDQSERWHAFQVFRNCQEVQMDRVTFRNMKKTPEILKSYQVIWYHRPDTASLSSAENTIIPALRAYVEQGGCLLLTLDAMRLLPALGLESTQPEARNAEAIDNGYGRKRGLHAFRYHPVFDSLFGGAYLFAPNMNVSTRQMGWFGNNLPDGKTVAVDWAYIQLNENSKLLTEYPVGRGKVLGIGAYTIFSPVNTAQEELMIFMKNCFRYLSYGSKITPRYWEYVQSEVQPVSSIPDSVILEKSQSWHSMNESMILRRKSASVNEWDIAGERMLVMGKESGGIEEIWSHPFMAIRDYEAGLIFEGSDSVCWLNDLTPEIEVRPESFKRTYRFRRSYLTEIIAAHPTEALAVIHYEFRSLPKARLVIRMKSNLRFMWPYSEMVTGKIWYDWNPGLNAMLCTDKNTEISVLAGSNRVPVSHLEGKYSSFELIPDSQGNDSVSMFRGIESNKNEAGFLMLFELTSNDQVDIVIAASSNSLPEAIYNYKKAFPRPDWVYYSSLRHYSALMENRTIVHSPNAEFNEGYKWALAGTDRFNIYSPETGKSLAAGYSTTEHGWDGGQVVNGRPGYAWFFGRDGVWSAYAMLNYGDFENVKTILEMFARYQHHSGKIFHELTTSGVVHYDAADASPLYVSLAGRYLRHTGDSAFVRKLWPSVEKALDFCYSTDTDKDGLIENTLVGHGWEEGGTLFGTHTTLYLASCWAEALHQASYIAQTLGLLKPALTYGRDEGRVLSEIRNSFWNKEKGFFFHGKYIDQSYHPELSVMAMVPLVYGQINDSSQWEQSLQKIGSNEFSTDWGVRIIGDNAASFKPGSYHQGSVWPLFTGWTSLAEYKYGHNSSGFSHLMDNLLTYRKWSLGFVPEVLHGKEYKPFGVCPHQCWSETMVLQPALEGMLGIIPDALSNRLMITPSFPYNWEQVKVTHIRMGNQYFDLAVEESPDKSKWKLARNGKSDLKTEIRLNLVYPLNTKFHRILVNGKEYEAGSKLNSLFLNLLISDTLTIEVFKSPGIAALPDIGNPPPGVRSDGYRIIREAISDGVYSLTLNGHSGSDAIIRLYSPKEILPESKNCMLTERTGPIVGFRYRFPDADSKYVTITLKFNCPR